jgi:hypothetical protein
VHAYPGNIFPSSHTHFVKKAKYCSWAKISIPKFLKKTPIIISPPIGVSKEHIDVTATLDSLANFYFNKKTTNLQARLCVTKNPNCEKVAGIRY